MGQNTQTGTFGEWRTIQRSAHPRLRPYIRGYVACSSLLLTRVEELHLPSTEIPLFLNFGAPHRRRGNRGESDWTVRDGAWIVGPQETLQTAEAYGERSFMIARFTPIGAHLFLRLPMHLIANSTVDLRSIEPALDSDINQRVASMPDWDTRIQAMDSLIAERVLEASKSRELGSAWQRLVTTDGRVAIGTLAEELECSRRVLIEKFRMQIGIVPRTAARIFRFNHAIRLIDGLTRNEPGEPANRPFIVSSDDCAQNIRKVNWADLAAICGYADQAHMIREFRAFAGTTPTAFLRNAAPNA